MWVCAVSFPSPTICYFFFVCQFPTWKANSSRIPSLSSWNLFATSFFTPNVFLYNRRKLPSRLKIQQYWEINFFSHFEIFFPKMSTNNSHHTAFVPKLEAWITRFLGHFWGTDVANAIRHSSDARIFLPRQPNHPPIPSKRKRLPAQIRQVANAATPIVCMHGVLFARQQQLPAGHGHKRTRWRTVNCDACELARSRSRPAGLSSVRQAGKQARVCDMGISSARHWNQPVVCKRNSLPAPFCQHINADKLGAGAGSCRPFLPRHARRAKASLAGQAQRTDAYNLPVFRALLACLPVLLPFSPSKKKHFSSMATENEIAHVIESSHKWTPWRNFFSYRPDFFFTSVIVRIFQGCDQQPLPVAIVYLIF